MLIDPSNKQKIIENLNRQFRTILSYGEDKGLVPVGQFIINDIIEEERTPEQSSTATDFQFAKVILTKVDDENVQIVLPMTVFLGEYFDKAQINAEKLNLGYDTSYFVKDVENVAKDRVLKDETLQTLLEAENMSLEKCGAKYIINGKEQSLNYSICPIDLGKYMERIRGNDFER